MFGLVAAAGAGWGDVGPHVGYVVHAQSIHGARRMARSFGAPHAGPALFVVLIADSGEPPRNTESGLFGGFFDTEDESGWTCDEVSNTADADGDFSVWCKCTTRGLPGVTSKTGAHVKSTFSIQHLRRKFGDGPQKAGRGGQEVGSAGN